MLPIISLALLLFLSGPISIQACGACCLQESENKRQSSDDNRLSFSVICPFTTEEVVEYAENVLGMFLLTTITTIGTYSDSALDQQDTKQFLGFFYFGLLLHSLIGRSMLIPYLSLKSAVELGALSISTPDLYQASHKTGLSTHATTGYPLALNHPLLFVHIISQPYSGNFFNVSSLLPCYASQLLAKPLQLESFYYTDDQLAAIRQTYKSSGYNEFELSITNPDNSTHHYQIAHQDGCSWVLSRDQEDIESQRTLTWCHSQQTIMSSQPNTASPLNIGRVIITVPRELLLSGFSELSTSYMTALTQVLRAFPIYFEQLWLTVEKPQSIVSFSGSTSPAIKSELPGLTVAATHDWKAVQLMDKPSGNNLLLASRTSSSSSSSSSVPSSLNNGDNKDKDLNGDDDEDKKEPPSDSVLPINDPQPTPSLLEEIAAREIAQLAFNSRSEDTAKIDIDFVRLLSRAGLAQVILQPLKPVESSPLAVSSTLLKYLLRTIKHENMALLRKKADTNSYYLQLDQEIFDEIAEQYTAVRDLASQRIELFDAFHQTLKTMAENSGKNYAIIGGEAIRNLVRNHPDHFLRDNFVITDDIDLFVEHEDWQSFWMEMPDSVAGLKMSTTGQVNILFTFPYKGKDLPFKSYRINLQSEESEFLPSLDIAIAAPEIGQINLDTDGIKLDSWQQMLHDSIDRVLQFKPDDRQKYLDRITLLKSLMPREALVSHLYDTNIILPAMKKKIRLLKSEQAATESKMESLEKNNRLLQEQVTKSHSIQKSESDIATKLEKKKDKLKSRLESAKEKVDELQAELKSAKEREDELQTELKSTKERADELQAKLDKPNIELSKLTPKKLSPELQEIRQRVPAASTKSKSTQTPKIKISGPPSNKQILQWGMKVTGGTAMGVIITLAINEARFYLRNTPGDSTKESHINAVINAYKQLPLTTRILVFQSISVFMPCHVPVGYVDPSPKPISGINLDEWKQGYDKAFDLKTFPVIIDTCRVLTPTKFKLLKELTDAENERMTSAIFSQIRPDDPEEYVEAFAQGFFLLCGVMPDDSFQKSCSIALNNRFREKGRWSCDDKEYVPSKPVKRFNDFVVPSLTKQLGTEFRLGLFPSWYVINTNRDEQRVLLWYSLWPAGINEQKIVDLDKIESCSPAIGLDDPKICEKESIVLKQFQRDYWNTGVYECIQGGFQININEIDKITTAFWGQAPSGRRNRFYACKDGKRLKTVW